MEKIMEIKKRLRKIREDKGLTRPQVSQETGISVDTLKGWEMNNFLPKLEQLIILTKYYNVSIDYLMCITDNPEINR